MEAQPQENNGRTTETIGPLEIVQNLTDFTMTTATTPITDLDTEQDQQSITAATAPTGIANLSDNPIFEESDDSEYEEIFENEYGFELYQEDDTFFPEQDLTPLYFTNPDYETMKQQMELYQCIVNRRTFTDNVNLYARICYLNECEDEDLITVWDLPNPDELTNSPVIKNLTSCPIIAQQCDVPRDESLSLDVFNAIMTNSKYREEHTYLDFQPRVQYSLMKEDKLWNVSIITTVQGNTKEHVGVASTRKEAKHNAIQVCLNSILKRTDMNTLSQTYLFAPDPDTGLQTTTMLKAYNEFLQIRDKKMKYPELTLWQSIGLIAHNVEIVTVNDLEDVKINMRFTRETTSYKGNFRCKSNDVRVICANITFEECIARNMGAMLDWLLSRKYLNTGKRTDKPSTNPVYQQSDTDVAFAVLSTEENTITSGAGAMVEVTNEPVQEVNVDAIRPSVSTLVHGDESVTLPYAESHMFPIATYILSEAETQTVTPFVYLDILTTLFELAPNIQLTMFTRTLLSRPKLHITIKLNATYVYQGRLVAEIIPQVGQLLVYDADGNIDYAKSRITVDDMIKRKATQFDIAASTDITLTMDFIDVLNALNNRDISNLTGYAHLLVGSVTPLRTGPDETAQLTLNIYAHLSNTEFMQRTFPIPDSEFRSVHKIRVRQEMMALAAGALGSSLLKKPVENLVGPITANMGAWIGKIVPKPASERVPDTRRFDRDVKGDYSHDRPEVPMSAVHIKPTYTDNLAIGLGEEQIMSMRLNPATEQQIEPNQTTPILDMVEIAQALSRVAIVTLEPTNVSQQLVYSQVMGYSQFPGSNMQYAMEMFTLIRSSIKVHLQYVKPMGLQGSLMLSFVPNVTTATFAQARNCKTHTVDLKDVDETDFIVPFWSTTVARNYSNDPDLGVFQIWVIVPITAPSITSRKLDVVVYIGADDDCELTALSSQSQLTSSYSQQSQMTEYLLNETHSHIGHILSRYNSVGSAQIVSSGGFDLTTAMFTGTDDGSESSNAITKILKLFKYMNTSFDILFEAIPIPASAIKSERLLDAQAPIVISPIPAPPGPLNVLSFTPQTWPTITTFSAPTLSNVYTNFSGGDSDAIQAPGTANQVRHSPYNTAANTILTLDFNRNGRTCTSNNNLVRTALVSSATTAENTLTFSNSMVTNINNIKSAADSVLTVNQYTTGTSNTDLGQNTAIGQMVTQLNSNVNTANDTAASLQAQINAISGEVSTISALSTIVNIAYSPPVPNVVPFTGIGSQKINTAINPSMNLFVPKMNTFARLPTFVRGISTDSVRTRMLQAATLGKFAFSVTNPVTLNMYARLPDGKQLSWFLGAPSLPITSRAKRPKLVAAKKKIPKKQPVQQQMDFESTQHEIKELAHEAAATGSQVFTTAEIHSAPKDIVPPRSTFQKIKHSLSPTHKVNKTVDSTVKNKVDPLLDKIESLTDTIKDSVTTTTNNANVLLNNATDIVQDVKPIPKKLDGIVDTVTELVDSVKNTLISAAERLSKYFSACVDIDRIISCLINIVIGIVNPNPLTITLTVLNCLLQLGIICSKTLKKLIGFFSSKIGSTPSISSETRNDIVGGAVQQCEHACPKCIDNDNCNSFCMPCKDMIKDQESKKLFNDADKVFLTTTLIGGISSVVGYCGKPKHVPMTTKLWDTSLNFWRTLPGISMFIRNLLDFTKKLCNRLLHRQPENKGIKIAQDIEFLTKFHSKITTLTNPSVQQEYVSTPQGRKDFIETHLQAQRILSKLIVLNHPQLTQLIVDLKAFVKFSGLKAKQIIISETGHAPLAVMLFGPTGIGKSYNMERFAYAALGAAKEKGLLNVKPTLYHHTDMVEFWNRYEGQPCIKIDELFPVNTPELLSDRLKLLMSLISDTVQNVNKADLADKHEVIQATLLITGTNTPFIPKLPTATPVAFHRRFHKVAMRFKVNDRLREAGKVPNTILEVTSSQIDQKDVEFRVNSHEEYLDSEKDDMYEFLFFKQNFGNVVEQGAHMYDRKEDDEPNWISEKEFQERLSELYCKSLEARQHKIENEMRYRANAIGEKYDEEFDHLEAILQERLVAEQIKMISEMEPLPTADQQGITKPHISLDLHDTPDKFVEWVEKQSSKYLGKCSKCMETDDNSTKQLVIFCSRRFFQETSSLMGDSKLTHHRCNIGLCGFHYKNIGRYEALQHFEDGKNCQCAHPKVASCLSEVGIFNKAIRSVKNLLTHFEMRVLCVYENFRKSTFWTLFCLITGGLSDLVSFPLSLRVKDFETFSVRDKTLIYIRPPKSKVPLPQPMTSFILPVLKKLHCSHVKEYLDTLDYGSRYTFVGETTSDPYYLIETPDQPDQKVYYYKCNENCIISNYWPRLLELWKEEHPKWQTHLNSAKSLKCTPFELIPHVIDKSKINERPCWYKNIGNKIVKHLTTILTILGTLGVTLAGIFGCYTLFKLWKKPKPVQQAYTTKGVKSVKRGIPTGALKNIRVIEHQSPQSEVIQDMLMTNLVYFKIKDTSIYAQGLCLRDRVVLLPAHCFRVLERAILAKRTIHVETMYGNLDITSLRAWKPEVFTENGWEYVLLYIRDMPQHRSIVNHLQTKLGHEFTPMESSLLHKRDGRYCVTSSKIHCFSAGPILSQGALGDEILKNYYVTSTSLKGACGGIYILPANRHPKPLAFAMHFAGSQFQEGYALPLIREMMDNVSLRMIKQSAVHQQGMNDRFGDLEIVAELQDPVYIPDKTKRRQSLISPLLTDLGLKCETFPAILSARDERFDPTKMGYSTPLMGGVLEHGTNPAYDFDQGLVDYAVEAWSKYYIEKAPPYSVMRSSYTAEEAIRGIRCGDTLVLKGMDLSTSVGIGGFYRDKMKTTKKHYITFDEDDILHMDQAMIDELEEQLVARQNGEAFGSLFMDQLKDELRTKLTTRTFSGSECVLTIITRMMKGPFITATTLNHLNLRTAIGMDTTSLEWDHLARDLLEHPLYLAGDFKAFGARIPRNVVEGSGKIAEKWFEYYFPKRDAAEVAIMKSCHKDICPALHVANKLVYLAPGGIPSGHPTTTLDNTISHQIMDFVVWMEIMQSSPLTLKYANFDSYLQHVHLWTLGDDEIKSISEEVSNFYDGLKISEVYAKYNIIFTDAQKKGNVRFDKWTDLEFLKSSFVRHPTREIWIARMRMTTVISTAHWIHKTDDEQAMTAQNAEQSLALAWGWGPEKYEELRSIYQECLKKVGIYQPLRSYKELDFMINSRTFGNVNGVFGPNTAEDEHDQHAIKITFEELNVGMRTDENCERSENSPVGNTDCYQNKNAVIRNELSEKDLSVGALIE